MYIQEHIATMKLKEIDSLPIDPVLQAATGSSQSATYEKGGCTQQPGGHLVYLFELGPAQPLS